MREVLAEIDEVKISLAFTNLIENAVKYNVDDGWVRVTLDADHKFSMSRWQIPASVFRRIVRIRCLNGFTGWTKHGRERPEVQDLVLR